MKKKTYKTVAIIASAIAAIGLVSYIGGRRPVNIGAFIFPLCASGVFFGLYKKK